MEAPAFVAMRVEDAAVSAPPRAELSSGGMQRSPSTAKFENAGMRITFKACARRLHG
jgi:hypothetical protein